MAWSVAPDLSLQELGRTFTYLAVFAVAVVAARRHVPGGARPLLIGVLLAAVAVCLWALATRIWPASLGGDVLGARLGEPFDYWNALGGMAALAVPGDAVAGAPAATRPGVAAALAYPALGMLLLTIMLTQSRGALAAAVLAALIWLAVGAAAPAHRAGAGRGRGRRGPGDRVGPVPGRVHRGAPAAGGARGRGGHVRPAVRWRTLLALTAGRLRGRAHPGHACGRRCRRGAAPASAWPPGWPWWPWWGWCPWAPAAAASASSWTS